MHRKITSDIVYVGNGRTILNGIVVADASGKILEVKESGSYPTEDCIYYPGFLMPGMINTHCPFGAISPTWKGGLLARDFCPF